MYSVVPRLSASWMVTLEQYIAGVTTSGSPRLSAVNVLVMGPAHTIAMELV